MSYDERKAAALVKLTGFLSTYTPPRGVDDDGQATIISKIADAFARRIPANADFDAAMEKVFQKIEDTHKSQSWPTQAHFVDFMPVSEARFQAPESFKVDNLELIARSMNEGVSVPERAVWTKATYLMSLGVPEHVIEEYRKYTVNNLRAIFKEKAHDALYRRYGSIADRYF